MLVRRGFARNDTRTRPNVNCESLCGHHPSTPANQLLESGTQVYTRLSMYQTQVHRGSLMGSSFKPEPSNRGAETLPPGHRGLISLMESDLRVEIEQIQYSWRISWSPKAAGKL
ncbi:hypothetical protein AVEN_99021-1 [Araneus ventricosus]|uniref:Uncharacterized protein n=1 Tax=Araneus ventricosus TaxID=182803 RepID=A0A4Y2G7L5_ARAVE|nr:hypothetical protein AVEN_99021-1 [Araneus ventricosus]